MTEIQAILLAQHAWASREKTASLILEMEKLVQYCQDKDKDCYKQGFVGMRENTIFPVLADASLRVAVISL